MSAIRREQGNLFISSADRKFKLSIIQAMLFHCQEQIGFGLFQKDGCIRFLLRHYDSIDIYPKQNEQKNRKDSYESSSPQRNRHIDVHGSFCAPVADVAGKEGSIGGRTSGEVRDSKNDNLRLGIRQKDRWYRQISAISGISWGFGSSVNARKINLEKNTQKRITPIDISAIADYNTVIIKKRDLKLYHQSQAPNSKPTCTRFTANLDSNSNVSSDKRLITTTGGN